MAIHGITWLYRLYMAKQGYTLVYMVIHGNTWVYMVIHGNTWLYMGIHGSTWLYIENTSWKVLAYGIYARVVDVSEIERVSAANE